MLCPLPILPNPQVQYSARGTDHVIRLEVPSLFEYRDLAMRMVASACKLVEVRKADAVSAKLKRDGQFTAQVMSAFGEAFNNVVLHSYDHAGGHLQIEVELAQDALTIRIMDFGKTFDIHNVPTPNLDDLPESGLGLFIIRSCMDVVTYIPGTPNVMSMTKYIGNQ